MNNLILQKERDIERLMKQLNSLKEKSVTVHLTPQYIDDIFEVQKVNNFITQYFDHIVYTDEIRNGVHIVVLKADPLDIYPILNLASKQTVNVKVSNAFENLAKTISESEGNTKHTLKLQ